MNFTSTELIERNEISNMIPFKIQTDHQHPEEETNTFCPRDLNALTNQELVEACLKTDAADYYIVEKMMDRLWPGWQKWDRY